MNFPPIAVTLAPETTGLWLAVADTTRGEYYTAEGKRTTSAAFAQHFDSASDAAYYAALCAERETRYEVAAGGTLERAFATEAEALAFARQYVAAHGIPVDIYDTQTAALVASIEPCAS